MLTFIKKFIRILKVPFRRQKYIRLNRFKKQRDPG